MTNRVHNNTVEAAYRRYAPALLAYVGRFVSADQVEDVVHDLFLKLWDRELLDLPEAQLRPLLFVSARNLCIDRLRRVNSRNALAQNDEVRLKIEEIQYSASMDELFTDDDLRHKIMSKAGELPEKRLEIFRMYYIEGLKAAKIAHRQNISVRTVENNLYRAIAFLREHFLLFFL